MKLYIPFFLLLWLSNDVAQCQMVSVSPAVVPVAVRSPYLNVWVSTRNSTGGQKGSLGGIWTSNWAGKSAAWQGIVRVDGKNYEWQGVNPTGVGALTNATGYYMSPTRTFVTGIAGPVQLNITYLSPVEPSDWVRQSFPFSYLSVDVKSTDGNPHSVQLYSGITGEWLSTNDDDLVEWATTQTSGTLIHSMQKQSQQPYTESNDFPNDGTLYLATSLTPSKVTWQTGDTSDFVTVGSLNNTQDTNFRSIGNDWPGLAFSTDLGSIIETTSPVVWAMGFVREPAIRAIKGDSFEFRSEYFWTQYDRIEDAIDAFMADFQNATQRATVLDNKLMSDAGVISSEYADLAALGLRQTFASMDITVARTSSGQFDASDVKVYMKDLGNSGRVNAVETLYAALPAFLYFNSTLAGLLLEPLLEFQNSSQYLNNYAAPDLGVSYPDVTGNVTDQSILGVESCGSMLVMVLAHAQKSGDTGLINNYYPLLKTWADYLVANIFNFSPTAATANTALKGIIGIHAMSIMSQVYEPQAASSSDYSSTAQSYIQKWQDLALPSGHVTSTYSDPTSWNLLYNAYSQALLNVSVINDAVIDAEANFYTSKLPSAPVFGFPYDSSVSSSRSDWTMFTAAVMPNAVRDQLISMVHTRAFLNTTKDVWPSMYASQDGTSISGRGSPAQGAVFALLAAGMPNKLVVNADGSISGPHTSSTQTGSDKRRNVGAIVGGIVGGIVFLALLAGILLWYRRKATRKHDSEETVDHLVIPFQSHFPVFNSQPTATNSSYVKSPMSESSNPTISQRDAPTILSQRSWDRSSSKQPTVLSDQMDESSLRNQVEDLRRQMAEMREAREMREENPPTYSDIQ